MNQNGLQNSDRNILDNPNNNLGTYDFLAGGGKMGERMRHTDWSKTPLGPIENWPQSLRSALSICLGSAFPIALYWGEDLVLLYNDAWSPILGSKHPWALGRTGYEVWPEIWDTIAPLFNKVKQTGEGVWQKDQLLLMSRHGYTEECYFNFTFSPIRGEAGVEGIFNAVVETTYQVINERRTEILRQLAERTSSANSAQAVYKQTAEIISTASYDIPFALLYLLDTTLNQAQLVEAVGLEASSPASPTLVSLLDGSNEVWPLAEVATSGKAKVVNNLTEYIGSLPSGAWDEAPHTALILPIALPGQERPYGLLVAGVSPRRELDFDYQAFFGSFSGQIANALGNAQAYEEERKRAEALAELDRAKTTFFSNVSHEFRTPLTLMLGPIEDTLAQKATLSPVQQERFEILHRNSLRLLRLVNALLDFSRIEAGRVQAVYEPTDLAAFTAELASSFRSAIEKAGMTLVVNTVPLKEPIYVDREMWEKIVLNLLSNAFKYTFQGSITVSLKPLNAQVELSVTDSGVGIPEKELPRLFERFHRVEGVEGRTFEGTGIGLALVQELVKLHGGVITVSSTVGQGSTFTVVIPTGVNHLPQERISVRRNVAASAVDTNAYVEEALRWLPGDALIADLIPDLPLEAILGDNPTNTKLPHILLADDNADMREYVKRLLSQKYLVETVADGQAALTAINQQLPDLVLTDVMMPKLDGFGLLRALRDNPATKTLPVIMLSARAGEEARIEGLEEGADDYLVKPFSGRELLARVGAHLALSRLRRQAQEAIQRSKEEVEHQRKVLYQTFMQAPVAISVLVGPDLVCELVNPMAHKMVGNRDILGKGVKEAFPELPPQILNNYYHVYQSGEVFSGREFPAAVDWDNNGKIYTRYWDFVYEPRRDENGKIDGVISVAVDVTEQVKARQRVEEQNRVLEMITSGASLSEALEFLVRSLERQSSDGMHASVLLLDDDGTHLRHATAPSLPQEYNAAIDGIAIGPGVGSCGTAAYIKAPVIASDITTDPLWRNFKDLASQHGLRACWSTPIFSADQQVLGTFALYYHEPRTPDEEDQQIIDFATSTAALVIEHKKAEKVLEKSLAQIKLVALENQKLYEQEQAARNQAEEANRLKDEFLATISHELRTPLTAFLGYAQMLKNRKRDDYYLVNTLDKMIQSARTQAQLIEDLLDISRIVSGKLRLETEAVDLLAVINAAFDTVRPAIEAKKLQVRLELDPAASSVMGDANRLQQLVWNLLSNATKFTPMGGHITIRLEKLADHAQISISDTGQGISPTFLPFVFDRFRQADGTSTRTQSGLGLGLAIVRHLVELHGGTVEAISAGEGQGATFLVSLPLTHISDLVSASGTATGRSEAGLLDCPPELEGLRVLVVDDQLVIVELISDILGACGVNVRTCQTAREALEAVRQWRPDVLISDIAMPGEDGYWLIRNIRALTPEEGGATPAIALTAYVRIEDRLRVLAAGFEQYVPKPVEPAELREVVLRLASS